MTSARDCAQLLLDTIPSLMRSMHGSMRHKRLADDEPLTMGQFRLMEMLDFKQRTLSELAASHHVTPSTMSRSVDLLVRRAWVSRESNPGDRRQVILSLTDEGRSTHDAMVGHIQDSITQLIEQLGPDERERLYDGLSVLRELLDRTPSPAMCDTKRET